MSEQRLIDTIRQFLELCEGSGPSEGEAEATLSILLDRLALASHAPAPADCGTDVEAPRREYQAIREVVGPRFPNYGLYQAAATEPCGEATVGDAIDDICDIVADLSEVAWLWDHAGETAGLWQFHFSFDAHWGEHLRSLQWYVHAIARA